MSRSHFDLLIYSVTLSERLSFVSDFVFQQRLQLSYAITTNKDEFLAFNGLRIQYTHSYKELLGGLWFRADEMLFVEGVQEEWRTHFIGTKFNLAEEDHLIDHTLTDPFSIIFFCITRYEHYLPYSPDHHGRMPLSESVLYSIGEARIPIVDLIIRHIGKLLNPSDPFKLKSSSNRNSIVSTIDIDFPWLLKNRKWIFRQLFLLKRGRNQPKKGYWKSIIKGAEEDPFDQYAFLKDLHEDLKLQPLMFWLNASRITKYDRTNFYKSEQIGRLISEVDRWSETGIHPSYYTVDQLVKSTGEKENLESYISAPITVQRQHFLRMQWPATLRNAIAMGIVEDFSSGFAQGPGFPLGTVVPVPFFDVKKNIATDLVLYSTHVMDTTLKQYMNLSGPEAYDLVTSMIRTIKDFNGSFVILWHNSSLSIIDGWQDWKEVYRKILEFAVEQLGAID